MAEIEEVTVLTVENFAPPASGCTELRAFNAEENLLFIVLCCHLLECAILAVDQDICLCLRDVAVKHIDRWGWGLQRNVQLGLLLLLVIVCLQVG